MRRMTPTEYALPHWPAGMQKRATMTHSEPMTPLKHLVKVLQHAPLPHRDHTYINGESLYFPRGASMAPGDRQSVIAAAKTVPNGRLPIPSTGISSPPAIFTRMCFRCGRNLA